MSIRVSKRDILKSYPRIIEIGYCAAQNLLRGQQRHYYTAGIYGWNTDIYIIDGVAICTGYRPFSTISHDLTHPIFEKAEDAARKVWIFESSRDFNLLAKKVDKILKKAIKETQALPRKI